MSIGPKSDDLADLPWPKPAAPSAEVSDAIKKHCTHGLCAKRGPSGGARFLGSVLISGLTIALLSFLSHASFESDAVRIALYGAVGWGLVLAALLFAGLGRPPGKRGSIAWRVGAAIVLPLAFFGYLAYVASSRVTFDAFSHGESASHAMRCGVFSLVVGGLVSGGVLLTFRGTDPFTPRLSGALVGLAGGLTSALAVGIGCPSHEAWHMWVSHGFVVVALIVFGVAFGRRALSP